MLNTLPSTFVAVVETGSITGAADSLGLAKSAVSQNLKRLEEQVGVRLAARTTRSLSLTPAGEHYYQRCKELLNLAKRSSFEMEKFGTIPSGSITLTAPHAMIESIVAPAIAEMVSQYPDLEPKLIADDERLDIVSRGIDVAITIGQLPDSGLKAQRLGQMENLLCFSTKRKELTFLKPTKSSLAEVQAIPYIAHQRETQGKTNFKLQSSRHAQPIELAFSHSFKANTVQAVIALARQGVGVAMLPDFAVASELRVGQLQRIFPQYGLGKKNVYAVHPYDSAPPMSVRATVAAIKDQFEKVAYNSGAAA